MVVAGDSGDGENQSMEGWFHPLGSGRSGVQVAEASWHLPQPPKNFARMDAIL